MRRSDMARRQTSDHVVRQHREYQRKQIALSASAAARKLLMALPKRVEKQRLSVEKIAALIGEEIRKGMGL
jgi:hypothetical protein